MQVIGNKLKNISWTELMLNFPTVIVQNATKGNVKKFLVEQLQNKYIPDFIHHEIQICTSPHKNVRSGI